MTPAEHYAEAERLITPGRVVGPIIVPLAQVHATLALYRAPVRMDVVAEGWPASTDAKRIVDEALTERHREAGRVLDEYNAATGSDLKLAPLVEPAPVVDRALRGDGAA
jgi:hypothetical protein